MLQTLKFAYYSFLYPKERDFIDMGFGIEARAKRCHAYWKPHINCTKDFQKKCFESVTGKGSLAVLGAGRLLDFDLDEATKHFSKIYLYDADPSVVANWQKIKNISSIHVEKHIVDLTGVLNEWASELSKFLKNNPKNISNLVLFFNSLKIEATQNIFSSCVVSLNLLSQIPIYWRDRVHKLLLKEWGIETNELGNLPEELEGALRNTFANLQKEHLELLSRSKAQVITLIYDRNFYYYEKNHSDWQVERSLFLDEEININGYKCDFSDSWLWHIAPQGIEDQKFGAIHEVEAKKFILLE